MEGPVVALAPRDKIVEGLFEIFVPVHLPQKACEVTNVLNFDHAADLKRLDITLLRIRKNSIVVAILEVRNGVISPSHGPELLGLVVGVGIGVVVDVDIVERHQLLYGAHMLGFRPMADVVKKTQVGIEAVDHLIGVVGHLLFAPHMRKRVTLRAGEGQIAVDMVRSVGDGILGGRFAVVASRSATPLYDPRCDKLLIDRPIVPHAAVDEIGDVVLNLGVGGKRGQGVLHLLYGIDRHLRQCHKSINLGVGSFVFQIVIAIGHGRRGKGAELHRFELFGSIVQSPRRGNTQIDIVKIDDLIQDRPSVGGALSSHGCQQIVLEGLREGACQRGSEPLVVPYIGDQLLLLGREGVAGGGEKPLASYQQSARQRAGHFQKISSCSHRHLLLHTFMACRTADNLSGTDPLVVAGNPQLERSVGRRFGEGCSFLVAAVAGFATLARVPEDDRAVGVDPVLIVRMQAVGPFVEGGGRHLVRMADPALSDSPFIPLMADALIVLLRHGAGVDGVLRTVAGAAGDPAVPQAVLVELRLVAVGELFGAEAQIQSASKRPGVHIGDGGRVSLALLMAGLAVGFVAPAFARVSGHRFHRPVAALALDFGVSVGIHRMPHRSAQTLGALAGVAGVAGVSVSAVTQCRALSG